MKTKRLLAVLTASALLATMLAGCGGDDASSNADNGGETAEAVKDVQVWATGSDNVRQVFEKLVEDFNTNSEYAGTYEANLNFILSGTGGGTLADQLVAAYRAGQTESEFDVSDLGDDDLTKILSLTDENVLQDLDMSLIPNAEGITAEPVAAKGKIQPYRGTTVILAYNSDTVPEDEVPTTMDELVEWIKAHPGRFAYNTPGTGGAGDSFVRTAIYNFIDDPSALMSDDPKWEEQWDEGFAFLKDLHPYMYKSGDTVVYPNKNQGTLDLLTQARSTCARTGRTWFCLSVRLAPCRKTLRLQRLSRPLLVPYRASAFRPSAATYRAHMHSSTISSLRKHRPSWFRIWLRSR